MQLRAEIFPRILVAVLCIEGCLDLQPARLWHSDSTLRNGEVVGDRVYRIAEVRTAIGGELLTSTILDRDF